MNNPFFSVIIPMFNSEKTIVRTLNSVVCQSYKNFEIIIIDDGSNDNSIEISSKFLNNYKIDFKIISLNKNKGVSFARNEGIRNSKGTYIAFIDSDDLWDPKKIKIQFEYIKKYDLKWTFSNYYVIDENYKIIGLRSRKEGYYNYNQIISNGNPVGILTCVVKTELLKTDNFENIHHEDYDLWIRLAKKGINGFLIYDKLAFYFKRPNSISSNKIKAFVWTFNVLKKNVGFIKSLMYINGYMLNYVIRKKVN